MVPAVKTLRFLLPYFTPYRWQYLVGLLFIPVSTFGALSIPRLMGDAVDSLERGSAELGFLLVMGGWILFYAVCRGIGLFASRYYIIGASRRLEFDLRNRLYDHLLGLDRRFYQSARTGDLMTRATLDVEAARTIAGPAIMYSANCLFMLFLAIPLMASVDPWLTLLVMVPLSLLSWAVRVIGPRVHLATRLAQESLSDLSSAAQENFSGMRVVKSYSMQEREIASFRKLCDVYYDRSLVSERISNWMGPIVGGVGETAVLLLILVGGNMILAGELSLGDLVKFSGYQAMLIWPMISIGWVVNQVHRGVASVGRLDQVFSERSGIVVSGAPAAETGANSTASEAVLPPRFAGRLEVRGLTFAFGERVVLRDIDMEIPAGSTVAIIGRTGSGKSTLVSLFPRLYPVPDGTIFLDGIDINGIPLDVLRRSIGFVPQETFLFSRSIEDNIAFGVPADGDGSGSATETDLERLIREYATVSRLDKDLDQLGEGLREVVGERGVTLSGGQRQRVAIARALIGRPPVLIFDDSLSAVDTHTEEEILGNLRHATSDLTVIVVSHRISTVRDADHIYVLDDGRIVERGQHDELVRRDGLYAELDRQQRLSDELEEM